jgi:hypothetical protein
MWFGIWYAEAQLCVVVADDGQLESGALSTKHASITVHKVKLTQSLYATVQAR